MGSWLRGLGRVRKYWRAWTRLESMNDVFCGGSPRSGCIVLSFLFGCIYSTLPRGIAWMCGEKGQSHLSDDGLVIGRPLALTLHVSLPLIGQVAVDLVVGQDGILGLEDLHDGGSLRRDVLRRGLGGMAAVGVKKMSLILASIDCAVASHDAGRAGRERMAAFKQAVRGTWLPTGQSSPEIGWPLVLGNFASPSCTVPSF